MGHLQKERLIGHQVGKLRRIEFEDEANEFVFHVRTPSRKEIDFVSESLGSVAIEGKYCEDGGWRSEATTVIASQWDGIVATRNVLDISDDQAWAVPSGMLAYLLDTEAGANKRCNSGTS